MGELQLLTHSRQDCFKTCRRKHYYSYELGMRPIHDSRALRMGSAFHDGIDALGSGKPLADACEAVRSHYADKPDFADEADWLYECETILRLVCAYQWRWQADSLTYIATESAFALPLLNPATGAASTIWSLAGKIDGIVRLEDGRLAVKETKTVSEDIGPDSPLWRRLRIDHQISLYIHAARRMGHAVDTVLYDVIRKPTIAPTSVPIVDADGIKIVLDSHGERVRNANKTWKQTGDTERGYSLQTRPMSVNEWGAKLTADIAERPAYYFARVEVPRLDQDVIEYQHELWDIQREIREAQRTGRHYRTVNRNTCQYCAYFEPCTNGADITSSPPNGFEFVGDVHPELGGLNVNASITTSAAAEGSATAANEVAAV